VPTLVQRERAARRGFPRLVSPRSRSSATRASATSWGSFRVISESRREPSSGRTPRSSSGRRRIARPGKHAAQCDSKSTSATRRRRWTRSRTGIGFSVARSNCVCAKSTAASSARASCSSSSSRTMRRAGKREPDGDIGQASHRLLCVPVMMDACMSCGDWRGRPCVRWCSGGPSWLPSSDVAQVAQRRAHELAEDV
jgi:hypothetical protein